MSLRRRNRRARGFGGYFTRTIEPTTPTTWPPKQVWYETKEHLNGWVVTRYTAERPQLVIALEFGMTSAITVAPLP